MNKHILLSALVGVLASASAHAQLIVGSDQTGSTSIWNVDVNTGVATAIYTSSGNDSKPWGMAYDDVTQTLYWNNGSVLYSSPFGAALTPVTVGTMMLGTATVNFVGLGFHNGKLYGTRNIATEAVYEIDPVTLQATQLFVYNVGFDFGGLDYDASTGQLYGLTDAAPAPDVRGLYRIDPVAMTTTFIAPYPAGETDIDGLAMANGRAYYVTDGPNTTQASFYVFDVATGMQVATLPSPFTGSGTFCAAAFAGNGGGASSTAFCFGDGSGTACPCANAGASGNGCASSVNAAGANLASSGLASISADSLVLSGTGMPSSSALYFQGTTQAAAGAGAVFGDGLRCAGGSVVRLKTVTNVAGSSQYPGAGDPSVSVRGMVTAPGVRTYQVWYRNAAAFCTPGTFNLTNGIQVNWVN